MAVLEIAILIDGEILFIQKFAETEDITFNESRNAIINTIFSITEELFDSNLNNFSIGKYRILLSSQKLLDKDQSLLIYCIVERDSDNDDANIEIQQIMENILDQFINKYSVFNIINFNIKKFKKFEDRIRRELGNYIHTKEERFNNIFG